MGDIEPTFESDGTYLVGLGWSDIGHSTISGMVDVKNGRIVRIRPTHYDWKYPQLKPWTLEARGKVWRSGMKSALAPFSIAYKKRAYSPNRIEYPLKRVDWAHTVKEILRIGARANSRGNPGTKRQTS